MTYLFLYIVGIILIWYIYKVGWIEAVKTSVSIIIPSILIILFNIKAGKLIFKSPIIGIFSVLPTSIFIFQGSKPIVNKINSWITSKKVDENYDQVYETEATSIDD